MNAYSITPSALLVPARPCPQYGLYSSLFWWYRQPCSSYLSTWGNIGKCQEEVLMQHGDVIKWKHLPRYWPFVPGIHWSLVNFPHKGQWWRVLMFSLICAWTNGWADHRYAGDLRRHRAFYDITVMFPCPDVTMVSFCVAESQPKWTSTPLLSQTGLCPKWILTPLLSQTGLCPKWTSALLLSETGICPKWTSTPLLSQTGICPIFTSAISTLNIRARQ